MGDVACHPPSSGWNASSHAACCKGRGQLANIAFKSGVFGLNRAARKHDFEGRNKHRVTEGTLARAKHVCLNEIKVLVGLVLCFWPGFLQILPFLENKPQRNIFLKALKLLPPGDGLGAQDMAAAAGCGAGGHQELFQQDHRT